MGGWISLKARPAAGRPDLDWLARAIWTIHRHRSPLHVAWIFSLQNSTIVWDVPSAITDAKSPLSGPFVPADCFDRCEHAY
jgi:hypothetical protein